MFVLTITVQSLFYTKFINTHNFIHYPYALIAGDVTIHSLLNQVTMTPYPNWKYEETVLDSWLKYDILA